MLFAILAVSGAGAALAVGAVADVEIPWWGHVLVAFAGASGTTLLGLLGRAFAKLFDYLAERTKLAFLAEVDEAVMGFVSELWQEEVAAAKAAAADGRLSKDEAARFKQIVVDKVLGLFRSRLAKVLGDSASEYLSSRIERAVVAHKVAGKAASGADKLLKAAQAVPR